jgi:hypothetical protein
MSYVTINILESYQIAECPDANVIVASGTAERVVQ